MKKVMTVLGTRPEAIKLMPVLKQMTNLDSVLVLTAQHQELVRDLLPLFGLAGDHDLALMRPGQSPAGFMARALPALDRVMEQEAPDLVLAQGDTTTVLAAALAAFHRQIPVAHLEAGLRTGIANDPFPEEMNRRLLSPLASLHFAPTRAAADNLRAEGVGEDKIRLVGNTIVDALLEVRRLGLRPPAEELRRVVEGEGRVALLTCHRRESFGAPMRAIFRAVSRLTRDFPDLRVIFPVHPNPAVQAEAANAFANQPRVLRVPPLDYFSFLWVLERSQVVISDSGGVQEEAPSFGVPVVVTRETTERMEGVEAGAAILAGRKSKDIYRSSAAFLTDQALLERLARGENPYGDGRAAARVVASMETFLQQDQPVPVLT